MIYRDEKPLHHLVAGDLDPTHPGDESVSCGDGGKLILLTPSRSLRPTEHLRTHRTEDHARAAQRFPSGTLNVNEAQKLS